MYLKRALEEVILETSAGFPVLLVTGPRQAGKTTLLRYLCEPDRKYVTLRDPFTRLLAKTDPALFFGRFEPPLLIDEIQYAPELLPYIKMQVDEERKGGRFWLTGSQMFHLMKHVSEYLVGRVWIINLLGFSSSELSGAPHAPFMPNIAELKTKSEALEPLSTKDLYQRIFRGSMPAMVVDEYTNREIFFSSYVQTYLEREIRELAQVGDELDFLRFLMAVAARTGGEVNYADLARNIGVSAPTAKL